MADVRLLAFVCVLSALCFLQANAHTTACNHGNATTCLVGNETYEGVRMFLQNNEYFWFGVTKYPANCPSSSAYPLPPAVGLCQNLVPQFTSIITRMRWSGDNDTDGVEQVLNVHWAVPAGSYMGCDGRVEVPALDKTVDAVHSIYDSAWSLNHRPHVSWTADPDAVYTVLFYDAGYFMLQGLWVNIRGDRLMGAQEVIPYFGPMTPYEEKNPYVWGLYRQNASNDIDVQTAFNFVRSLYRRDGHVKLNLLVAQLGLEGPVGVSLIRTYVDEYSAMMVGRKQNIINNCPYLMSKAIGKRTDLPFNTTANPLKVTVEVTYEPNFDFEGESCCQKLRIPKNIRRADSRFEAGVEPVFTRLEPRVNIVPTPLQEDPFYFANRRFTLLFVDISDKASNPSDPNYILHWQVINIRDPMASSGEATVPYVGAMVSLSGNQTYRTYAYLLFEQSGELTKEQVTSGFVANDCGEVLNGRCKFNLAKFQTDLNLKLVGATGHRSSPDGWSRLKSYTTLGTPRNAACVSVEGFSDPCPSTPAPCPSTLDHDHTHDAASVSAPNVAALTAMLFLLSALFV